jgi:hypothetical protein
MAVFRLAMDFLLLAFSTRPVKIRRVFGKFFVKKRDAPAAGPG